MNESKLDVASYCKRCGHLNKFFIHLLLDESEENFLKNPDDDHVVRLIRFANERWHIKCKGCGHRTIQEIVSYDLASGERKNENKKH